jgi:hypothetical protein
MTTNSNTANDAVFDEGCEVTDVDIGGVGVAAVRTPPAPVPHRACWAAMENPDRSRSPKARASCVQVSVSLVIVEADRPLAEPRNCPSAGTKSPLESPCRYSSGRRSPSVRAPSRRAAVRIARRP